MAEKSMLSIRASELTREKLDYLQAVWGTTQTEALTVIVDRAYHREFDEFTLYLAELVAGQIADGIYSPEEAEAQNNGQGWTFDREVDGVTARHEGAKLGVKGMALAKRMADKMWLGK